MSYPSQWDTPPRPQDVPPREQPVPRLARLQIRAHTYRGQAGWLVCGRDALGRRPRVFTLTRGSAEHIKAKLRAGQQIETADFAARGAFSAMYDCARRQYVVERDGALWVVPTQPTFSARSALRERANALCDALNRLYSGS